MYNPLAGAKFCWTSRQGPISVEDYRQTARRRLPDIAWVYIDGGAEDLVTMGANSSAFRKWSFCPRVLASCEAVDLATSVAGQRLDFPMFLAPTGMSGLAHWTGEVAAAQAAERVGVRAVISTAASYTPEEVAAQTKESHFFQLYPAAGNSAESRAITDSFIARAHDAGYGGLFVTVDVPVRGNREDERRRGLGVPPLFTPGRLLNSARHVAWSYNVVRHNRIAARMLLQTEDHGSSVASARRQLRLLSPSLNWDDFSRMREKWKKPLFIKGVLSADDAAKAVDLGADGVVVSNHGGRQLDGAVAAIDALPNVVDRIGHRVPVLLDGGVRRGSDVVKALCLGATAVGIGRPYLYGLAVSGGQGVEHVLNIFREEIQRTMTLLGCRSVSELSRSLIVNSR